MPYAGIHPRWLLAVSALEARLARNSFARLVERIICLTQEKVARAGSRRVFWTAPRAVDIGTIDSASETIQTLLQINEELNRLFEGMDLHPTEVRWDAWMAETVEKYPVTIETEFWNLYHNLHLYHSASRRKQDWVSSAVAQVSPVDYSKSVDSADVYEMYFGLELASMRRAGSPRQKLRLTSKDLLQILDRVVEKFDDLSDTSPSGILRRFFKSLRREIRVQLIIRAGWNVHTSYAELCHDKVLRFAFRSGTPPPFQPVVHARPTEVLFQQTMVENKCADFLIAGLRISTITDMRMGCRSTLDASHTSKYTS
jgi:hypothetical protein